MLAIGGIFLEISIERYLAINFVMDALVLGLAARSKGHVHLARVALAALLCAIYAVLARIHPFRVLTNLPFQVLAIALGTVTAMRSGKAASIVRNVLLLYVCALFLGGAQLMLRELMPNHVPAALIGGACAGAAATSWLLTVRSKRIMCCEVRVVLWEGLRRTGFTAMVDTGNRLREPISALPVLIVEQSVLPTGFGESLRHRTVRFGALGGGGTLRCFRPDAIGVDFGKGLRPAPDVWIAVYPGTMPGRVQALAPACMAMENEA